MKTSIKALAIVTTVALFTISTQTALASELKEYQGSIGQSPIHLTLEYNDSFNRVAVSGVYAYDKYDTPIFLNGKVENGNLILSEQDENWKPTATITIPKFNNTLINHTGTWQSLHNGKSYPVKLQLNFDYDTLHKNSAKPILIADSNKNHYFKLALGKDVKIKGLQIYKKGSDKLIQEMPYSSSFSLQAISTDDYNFDGHEDFSYLLGSGAGSNSWSTYFLWNPQTKQYEKSSIEGSSLSFDQNKKRIYSENRSGAGRYATYITYKLDKNDDMIELNKKCTERAYDDKGTEIDLRCSE